MPVTVVFIDDYDELVHYGTKRHSGRYPWGSGNQPYQGNNRDLLANIADYDPQAHALPVEQWLEIDRYALVMTQDLQSALVPSEPGVKAPKSPGHTAPPQTRHQKLCPPARSATER